MTLPRALLSGPSVPTGATTVAAHLSLLRERHVESRSPIERALLGGFGSDRVGFAFAAGYREALRQLVPAVDATIVSFSATEAAGNHPRAIASCLTPRRDGFVLDGMKRWATLGPVASELLVVCREGEFEGRPRLRVARVRADLPGVTVEQMAPTPFVPEVPHAEVSLAGVELGSGDVLPGDGYTDHVKPFRTVEDVHVHGALVGYLLGVASRCRWPRRVAERLAAIASALVQMARSPALDPETHVALAGVLDLSALVVDATAAEWGSVPQAERERWERDRGLVQVASRAREARLEAAWRALAPAG